MNTTTKRLAAAITGTVIAGVIAVGAAAPANASAFGLPSPAASSSSSSTPTPGVTGLTTEHGQLVLSGTGIPGASITVQSSGSGGTLTSVDADGTWKSNVFTPAFGDYTIRQGKDGVRSAPVYWAPGDPSIPAGSGEGVVTPPPSGPATPVVGGVVSEGGRTYLTGTGTPNHSIVLKGGSGAGLIDKIAADGTWKVDVTGRRGVVEVREGGGGKQSAPAYFTLGY